MNQEQERQAIREIENKLKRGKKLSDKEWAIYSYSKFGLAAGSCRCKR